MCLIYFGLVSISNILLRVSIFVILLFVSCGLVFIFFLRVVASCGVRVRCMGTICNNPIYHLIFTTSSIITIPSILIFSIFSIIVFLLHFYFFFNLLSSIIFYLLASLFCLGLQELSRSIFFCFLFHFYEVSLNRQSALRL